MSKQAHGRCTQPAVPGLSVCHFHGGATKRAREAATRRLATLIDPALSTIAEILSPKRRRAQPAVALKAAHDVLDRTGIGRDDQESGVLTLPDPGRLPPGTAVTTTFRVERLTDGELAEMKRLLLKLGVEELPQGPAQG